MNAPAADLPIVDLDEEDPSRELTRGLFETGFFLLRDHVISRDLLDGVRATTLAFLARPEVEKLCGRLLELTPCADRRPGRDRRECRAIADLHQRRRVAATKHRVVAPPPERAEGSARTSLVHFLLPNWNARPWPAAEKTIDSQLTRFDHPEVREPDGSVLSYKAMRATLAGLTRPGSTV